MTVADALNSAAKALGKLRSGGGLCPSELADGLTTLNFVVDWFSTRKAFVYTTRQDQYPFTDKAPPDGNNPAVYTIGPSGADFTAPRPTHIEHANVILTDATPGVFYQLEILDVDQWAAITLQQLPVTLPQKMYCDYASPNANLYFWGQPIEPYILQLFTWQQMAAFGSLAQPIGVPPGYLTAFTYSLAELLGPQWNVQVPQAVTDMARKARAGVQSLNSKAPRMQTLDSGMPGCGRGLPFNYRSRSY